MSEKSRHDSALINTSPGSASPRNPGKTAKIARKTLEKRQKQAKSPWKNGKNRPKSLGKTAKTNYFCKKQIQHGTIPTPKQLFKRFLCIAKDCIATHRSQTDRKNICNPSVRQAVQVFCRDKFHRKTGSYTAFQRCKFCR
ncbi:hypothetical protein [Duncaniella muris]|uniref:hypothetical protein n=1 Tax=Duncaniella muris TaxID=2094150 RepID=UPI0025A5E584|nr:hypothetical protein [Duncaniella muris]